MCFGILHIRKLAFEQNCKVGYLQHVCYVAYFRIILQMLEVLAHIMVSNIISGLLGQFHRDLLANHDADFKFFSIYTDVEATILYSEIIFSHILISSNHDLQVVTHAGCLESIGKFFDLFFARHKWWS